MVYNWYVPRIYPTYDHLVHMTGTYCEKHSWEISVPVTYPNRQGIYLEYSNEYFHGICQSYELNGHMTGITLEYFRYIPYIYFLTWNMPGIYYVYSWHIPGT